MRQIAVAISSTTSPVSVSTTTTMTQQPHQTQWHSPVPYLFGGLAAMLGLIAFALLILACSYWRLSGRFAAANEGEEDNRERDLENGEKEGNDSAVKQTKVFEEKILVIMAGQEKPTYLATPVSSKAASSFNNNDKNGETEKTTTTTQGSDSAEEKVESSSEDDDKVKTEQLSVSDHRQETEMTHHQQQQQTQEEEGRKEEH